jgi:2-C-methyl-D-erythritol 4-phosphate cytidylyltransferase
LEREIGGKAVLLRSVELFCKRPDVVEVIVAVDPDEVDRFRFRWGDRLGLLGVKIVAGGKAERWETVKLALGAIGSGGGKGGGVVTHVAVHDAARPVTDLRMIERVLAAAAAGHDAVIPTVPVHATVKRIEKSKGGGAGSQGGASTALGGGVGVVDPLDAILGDAGKVKKIETRKVLETIPREGLELVQTPQVFRRSVIERAYAAIESGKIATGSITDDAGLIEATGGEVVAVAGDPFNVKITLPDDVAFAEAVLKMRGTASMGEDVIGPKRKHPTWAESKDE